MSSPGGPDFVTVTGLASPPAVVPAPCPHHHRDPWLRIGPNGVNTLPLAGQPGHGSTAVLRRQSVRIVDGRFEGGYTHVFELLCPSCGDHPYLDHSEIPPRLQRLRGPPLEAGLAAYDKHPGLPQPTRTEPEASGPGYAKAKVGGA